MWTSSGARYRSSEVSSSLPCIGPSPSSSRPLKSRSNTSTVKTRAWCVRKVDRASWCGSWPCAVRMMKVSTPACSHEPSRSFIQRCSVLRRTEAFPGKGRWVDVLTPYSMVGARRISSAPDRSSARHSTMMVSHPSGRCGPCCSHVPTGARWRLRAAPGAARRGGRRLAERGGTAALLTQEAAFDELRRAVAAGTRARGVERGVVLLAPDGEPFAWAGRHRFVPARDTAELRAVITPFYVSLEARRQTPGGGSAVGSVLLDAAPAAPDGGHAVSARFRDEYGVALRFYAPGLAPREGNVFDYCLRASIEDPTKCAPGAALLSVQPVPPSQSDAKLAALGAATARAGVALALVLLLVFITAPAGAWRWLVAVAVAWTVARALQDSARWAGLFSPASFYRPMLGGFSASAGALTAPGAALLPPAAAGGAPGLAPRGGCLAGARPAGARRRPPAP